MWLITGKCHCTVSLVICCWKLQILEGSVRVSSCAMISWKTSGRSIVRQVDWINCPVVRFIPSMEFLGTYKPRSPQWIVCCCCHCHLALYPYLHNWKIQTEAKHFGWNLPAARDMGRMADEKTEEMNGGFQIESRKFPLSFPLRKRHPMWKWRVKVDDPGWTNVFLENSNPSPLLAIYGTRSRHLALTCSI